MTPLYPFPIRIHTSYIRAYIIILLCPRCWNIIYCRYLSLLLGDNIMIDNIIYRPARDDVQCEYTYFRISIFLSVLFSFLPFFAAYQTHAKPHPRVAHCAGRVVYTITYYYIGTKLFLAFFWHKRASRLPEAVARTAL